MIDLANVGTSTGRLPGLSLGSSWDGYRPFQTHLRDELRAESVELNTECSSTTSDKYSDPIPLRGK